MQWAIIFQLLLLLASNKVSISDVALSSQRKLYTIKLELSIYGVGVVVIFHSTSQLIELLKENRCAEPEY